MSTPEGEGKTRTARRGGGKSGRRTLKARVADRIMREFERKLRAKNLSVSVTDAIRVMQMETGEREESIGEVKVSWVEPKESESAGEK